jgi:cell division protein FtsN
MKENIYLYLLLFLLSISIISCSSSTESSSSEDDAVEEEKTEDVYVYDETPSDTVINEPVYDDGVLHITYFKVQIGAFTTKERAEEFAAMSRNRLQEEMDITYNEEVNLFVVQLQPSFKSKEEAEKVRDQIRTMEEYKDSWIVTVGE